MAWLEDLRLVGGPLRFVGPAGRLPVVGRAVRRGGRALLDVEALARAPLAHVRPAIRPPSVPLRTADGSAGLDDAPPAPSRS